MPTHLTLPTPKAYPANVKAQKAVKKAMQSLQDAQPATLDPQPASKPISKPIRMPKLTRQQREFVYEYVRCWNATKSAIRSGYSAATAKVTGYKLLTNKSVQAALLPMMRELHVTPDRVMSDLGAVAGADISDFLADGADGKPTMKIDPAKVAAHGLLVKSFEETRYGTRLELHDRMAALALLARILKMTGESVQNQVNIQFNVAVSGEDV